MVTAARPLPTGAVLGDAILAPNIMNMGDEWVDTKDLEFRTDGMTKHSGLSASVEVAEEQGSADIHYAGRGWDLFVGQKK